MTSMLTWTWTGHGCGPGHGREQGHDHGLVTSLAFVKLRKLVIPHI
jgi:hypothetical protein